MKKSPIFGLVAGLAMGPLAFADEISNSAASANDVVWVSTVSCNGNPGVFLTADQAQSLPLQIKAHLGCGQEVQVLSDPEEYTVNIQTQDAVNGYIARIYLTPPQRKRLGATPIENAAPTSGVVRWQSGAKGSVEFMSGDKLVESLTTNGITVQVSLQDSGWKLRANIAVNNGGREATYVLPRLVTLDEVAPLLKPLRYQDPGQVAKAATHQALWTTASAEPAINSQPQRHSATVAALSSASFRSAPGDASPNYLAQQYALEETAARSQSALVDLTREIKALSLPECTLTPGEKTAGAVWFDRDGKSKQLLLRVPVDGLIFEFPLSFNHEK
jgi:hypothetical protein